MALFVATCIWGQDFEEQFNAAFQEQDTTQQRAVLMEWEREEPQNPELFTSYFNFYFRLAQQEVMTVTKEQPTGEYLTLEDSTGTTAGYMASNMSYQLDTLAKGFEKIDQALPCTRIV